jgi:hypothetical protein
MLRFSNTKSVATLTARSLYPEDSLQTAQSELEGTSWQVSRRLLNCHRMAIEIKSNIPSSHHLHLAPVTLKPRPTAGAPIALPLS